MLKLNKFDALFIQAGIAAALSFSHVHDIAAAAGQGDWQSWCYPVSVDLLLFASWRRIRAGRGGAPEWSWFAVALIASLAANVATAGALEEAARSTALSVIVAGWPAVAFLGGTLLVHSAQRPATTVVEPVALSVEPLEPIVEADAPSVELVAPTVESAEPIVEASAAASSIVPVSVAAQTLGLSDSTIRGWASAAQQKLTDHGYEGRSRLVDMEECRALMA